MSTHEVVKKAWDILASDNHDVILHLEGDPAFGGVAVRFGELTGIYDGETTLIVHDYHDSSGAGPYPGYRRGVDERVPVSEVIRIKQNWHQV